jgi:hypothetical protein
MIGPREVLDWRGDERTFHIPHPLCTGLFSHPVGMVGKQGRLPMIAVLISNNPELHSRVLENRAEAQLAGTKSVRFDFHFSCMNYGYYCLFLINNY